jgi:hypothetical protein
MVVLTALLVSILIIELFHYPMPMVVLIRPMGKINLYTTIITTITVLTIAVPKMETIVIMFMEGILITLIIT